MREGGGGRERALDGDVAALEHGYGEVALADEREEVLQRGGGVKDIATGWREQ